MALHTKKQDTIEKTLEDFIELPKSDNTEKDTFLGKKENPVKVSEEH
ncbi:hypothetical protein H9L19_00065 [Weissella diestrammenae]|uniref:Uncharacterized protein n=1 Tax=Weissella diestrammenae TaxID=1162633 RepID=A0A7G9T5G5_9LACO|nr:hypothetical protein [Weissella diestrammenae]MCM0583201.1 hypothetical protein [Weissella diestrammenae]QNN75340.1 hypothetical protein H9L19_00065 [Weissella diestrammenae]